MKISLWFPRPLAPEKCDWQAEWERLYDAYSPSATARSLSCDLSATYYPASPAKWARLLASKMPKAELLKYDSLKKRRLQVPDKREREQYRQAWERHADYLMTIGKLDADVRGFALYWSLKEAKLGGVYARRREKAAAKRLVLRFYAFAGARYDYHCEIVNRAYPEAAKGILLSERGSLIRAKLIHLTGRYRQPRRWQDPELDLWLILAWPVVARHHWNYADVERARRMKFCELPKGTTSFVTMQGASKAFEALLEGKEWSFAKYAKERQDSEEGEWVEQMMGVTRGDREAMEKRCRKLGLRLGDLPRRGGEEAPPMLEFALSITA